MLCMLCIINPSIYPYMKPSIRLSIVESIDPSIRVPDWLPIRVSTSASEFMNIRIHISSHAHICRKMNLPNSRQDSGSTRNGFNHNLECITHVPHMCLRGTSTAHMRVI